MFFFRSNMFYLPQLETKRLLLRQIRVSDAPDVFAYSKDPEVARYVLWQAQTELKEAKDYCRAMVRQYRMDEPASWGIVDKSGGHLIGTIGYMDYDSSNRSTEIGYSLARWKWNQGLMTEALTAVVGFLFSHTDVNRICAKHATGNPRSGHVMKACGLAYEGTLRQAALCNTGLSDVSVYSILRKEWEAGMSD